MASRFGSFGSYAANPNGRDENSSDFIRLSQAISNNIQKINLNVIQMRSLLRKYGTPSDSIEVHEKLHEVQHVTNQLAKDTNNYIKNITNLPPSSVVSEQRQQKLQQERLVSEFRKAVSSFQDEQQQEKVKEKTCTIKIPTRTSSASYDAHMSHTYNETPKNDEVLGGQKQLTLQVDSTDIDLEIMREQEDALRKLEADILAVNEIFRDLGMMVHEQGDTVDTIEANVESAAVNVEQGTKELQQAEKHQSSARKKIIIISVIIAIVVIIIIIILAAKLAPKE